MKRLMVITAICLYSLLGISYALPKTYPSKTAQTEETVLASYDIYTVSEYKGYVAVFENSREAFLQKEKGTVTPYIKTEVKISELPKTDQDILKKGIEVSSKQELKRVLEDYCS